MKRLWYLSLTAAALVTVMLAFAGCNIFDFGSDAEKSPVSKAEDNIADGKYTEAREELADQVDSTDDPLVLYTYAKASILEAGIDVSTIIDLAQGETPAMDGQNLPLLEKLVDRSVSEQNEWYMANINAVNALQRIWNEEVIGVLDREDIALDYSIALMIKALLGLQDTNQDGVINAQQDPSFDLISMFGSSGFSPAYFVTENGLPVNKGLTPFLGNWTPAGKLSAGAAPMDYTYSPDDINTLIAYVLTMIEQGEESIQYLIDMYNESDRDMTIDYEDIQAYMFDIVRYLNYYWYNDDVDNDGDGRTDEETIDGIDNDGDGFIDEDSDYHNVDTTNVVNDEYIVLFEYWYERLGLN